MLIPADEMLIHQVGRPLLQTTVSDHRFFDRHWFAGAHPEGKLAFILGMGAYRNVNVIDGFLSVQHARKQHNLRLSRVWRPDIEAAVAPLRIEVVEPFRHLRLTVDDNPHGLACALDWRSHHALHVEDHHLDVIGGMITQDSTRYDQAGTVDGWIRVDGERHAVENWWGVRDHSWGVRPGVGGFEPQRGDHALQAPAPAADQLRLWLWACFTGEDYSCQFQQQEDARGRRMRLDGELLHVPGSGKADLEVVDLEHDIRFFAGTHALEWLRYRVTLSDDSRLDIEAEPLVRAWAYRGTGYDRGYRDGRGLGAQRGNPPPEYDVYDLSDPEIVRDAGGAVIGPGHREQPVVITVNGRRSFGYFPVMVFETLIGMA
jgi:hypothetical protein